MHSTNFIKPVDGALYAVSLGFKVFPVVPNGKEPALQDWQNWAETATQKKIVEFGTANPLHNWAVYCGGSELTVLDVDIKKDRPGMQSLKELQDRFKPLPSTFTVRTPTGGMHQYFTGAGRNTTGLLGIGLDTRGKGGYVLCPGSRLNDSVYEIIDSTAPAPAPEWLLTETKKFREPEVLKEGVPVEEGRRNEILTSFAGTLRRRGAGYETILAALLALNTEQVDPPLPEHEVDIIAKSICRYKPEQAEVASDFLDVSPIQALRASEIDANKIPARDWIMQHRYMTGFLSVVVSPGGVGKSMLTMLDSVSIASGRALTGFDVARSGGVWLLNLEDPMDELKRRMAALCLHYGVPLSKLDNVFITSGQDHPFVIAKKGQDGIVINQTALDNACQFIRENNIVLMLVDPFIRSHECEENDNMQMDKIASLFSRLAVKGRCAVGAIHHTGKAGANMAPGEMNAARGASALLSAARIAHTVSTMTVKEAQKFGVASERRRWYFRFDNAKANMQPPAERADWFERKSIILPNSDSVGVIERINMREIKKERESESEKAERRDLGDCLYELMSPDNEWPVDHVALMITKDEKFAHLFAGHSQKYVHQKLLNLLNKYAPIRIRDREFSIDYDPQRRPKYLLKCFQFDMKELLEDALN